MPPLAAIRWRVLMAWALSLALLQAEWTRHTIDPAEAGTGKRGADGVRLADVNGDSFPDVVTGWENGDAIRVCVHPGLEAVRQPWPGVTVGRVAGAEDAVLADLDGDGAMDVITSTEGKTKTVFVHWAPASPADYLDGSAWRTGAFPQLKQLGLWMYALPFQVDGRAGIDLVVSSKGSGATVGWLANPDDSRALGDWSFTRIHDAGWIMSLREADLDEDGKPDVVFSDRKGKASGIYWLQGTGDETGFKPARLLGGAGREVMFLDLADADGDGDWDIIAAAKERSVLTLLQPDDGPGGTWFQEEWQFPEGPYGNAKAVRLGDLDGDAGLDAVITCEHAHGARSGVLGVLDFRGAGTVIDIGGPEGVKFDRIELLDLDGDGDLDVMTCEERDGLGVIWYENPGN